MVQGTIKRSVLIGLSWNPCHPLVSLTFPRSPSKQAPSPQQKPPRRDSPQLFFKINEIFPLRNPLLDGGTKTTLARRNRFAPPGYWLHLTQRGNYRQSVFSSDADREHFLSLLETHSEERGVRIAAYTLMSNHFHLVAAGEGMSDFPLKVATSVNPYNLRRFSLFSNLDFRRNESC